VVPDLRILNESELKDEPDVYACAAALGQYDLSAEEAAQQGRCTAANLIHTGSVANQIPLALRGFGNKVCDGFTGGNVRLVDGGRERMQFDGPKNIYKKIFLFNDQLVGAVWLNALEEKKECGRLWNKKFL